MRRHLTVTERKDDEQTDKNKRPKEDDQVERFVKCQVHEKERHQTSFDRRDDHHHQNIKASQVKTGLGYRDDGQKHQRKKDRQQHRDWHRVGKIVTVFGMAVIRHI